jgi:PAS domain S-box-containing protein
MYNQKNHSAILFKLRQEAELLLSKNEEILKKPHTESDNLQLIHELEVYQVELELQNDELKHAKDKAELAEKKYTELYDCAPSGYLSLTEDGVITELNKSAERLLGKERSTLIKSSFGFFVSPDTRADYNHFLQDIFKNKVKKTCELKLETGTDSIKYIHANGIISNIDKKCLVTLIDITKRKHAENELKKAKEKAEEGDRLKSAFLANMSHEIRTPMNGILGFTELLKTLNLNIEKQQNYIEIIEKSGARMLSILNDIIDISKIESNQTEVFSSDTNANQQVEFIYNFFKYEAKQKKLHLLFKNGLPANEAFMRTDREKLYAILTNLVKNAIKFTDSGYVEFGYQLKGDYLEFYVKDTGPGIPEEQKELIFERFRQGNESFKRRHDGAGLGLSISKAYVGMLGGKIWVENNTDKKGNASGAKFLFTIPAQQVSGLNHVNQVFTPVDVKKVPALKLNILIAEDDDFSSLLYIKLVEGITSKVFMAKTGIEAVAACRDNPEIDLVLMDINMPEMNGYEATREIREFNTDVVIIAQTGFAFAGDMEKSLEAGCSDSITKPINGTDLIKRITNCFVSHCH